MFCSELSKSVDRKVVGEPVTIVPKAVSRSADPSTLFDNGLDVKMTVIGHNSLALIYITTLYYTIVRSIYSNSGQRTMATSSRGMKHRTK